MIENTPPTLYQKSLVAFLYFIQGVFLVIPSTIILTYKQIPSYDILAMFSFATLPFSFKFIAAPLIEKYTIHSYGRRKTWIIISLTLASLLLLLTTFFTKQQAKQQVQLAICLTSVIFMVALEDISTDALAVKQLNSSQIASFMQCVWQPIGGVVGSLLFLELVSGSLYKKLGFEQPFITINEYLVSLCMIIILSVITIHFTYKQKVNDQQKQQASQSLWGVIKNYKYFVNPKYRLCRQGLLFLFHHHGIIYFSSSFTVELIKKQIISKDVLTTISNLLVIPVYFLTATLRQNWSDVGKVHKRSRIMHGIRLFIMVVLFFSNFSTPLVLYIFIAILSLLANTQFFLNSLICNNFTDSKYAGMYVTMMASFTNFGHNSAIQLEIISKIGHQNAILFGFCYSFFIILAYGMLERWVKRGRDQKEAIGYQRVQKQA